MMPMWTPSFNGPLNRTAHARVGSRVAFQRTLVARDQAVNLGAVRSNRTAGAPL